MTRTFLPHVITDDSALGGSVIQRSLRFNDGDSANLTRTSSSASTTFTYSAWIKRTHFSGYQYIFSMGSRGFAFHTNNQTLYLYDGSNLNESSAKFRDSTAWYHIVVQINSGTATSYVNGVLVHNGVGGGAFTLTTGANETRIGSQTSTYYFDGYMTEINLVDGSVVAPTEFGFTEPQTGIWMPKRYEGAYGTNGFYLDFSDNSSTATLGIDKSPNGNDFTANNFSVTAGKDDDSMIDTPTNNFPTFNLSNRSTQPTISQGNLRMYYNYKPATKTTRSTFRLPKSGKYYWEWQNEESSSNPGRWQSTIGNVEELAENSVDVNAANNANFVSYSYGGSTWNGTTHVSVSWDGTTRSWYSPERAAWAVDCDTGNVWVGRVASDGTTQWWAPDGSATGNPSKLLNPTCGIDKDKTHEYTPMVCWHDGGAAVSTGFAINVNFGQHSFLGTIPDGFKTLSSANIPPDPTINTIVRPQRHFDTLTYTGNGATSSRAITGLEFTPDFVWLKNRESTYHHQLHDTIRGVSGGVLYSNEDSGEDSTYSLASFDSNGFSISKDANQAGQNNNGDDYVAWCWKAGGAAVANTDGTLNSQVSVNEEAGFSIVSWTSTGTTGSTIGHGLGKKPDWIVLKGRNTSEDQPWRVYHKSLGATGGIMLDSTSAFSAQTGVWNDTEPTSSVFTVGSFSSTNENTKNYIAYCWYAIPGFSKFGSYTGNGSSDGPYIHLGFRPAWTMIKSSSATWNWVMQDTERFGGINSDANDKNLAANSSSAEPSSASFSGNQIDYLSNGFKLRSTAANTNASGGTYIYMAFAEQPDFTNFDTFANAK